MLTVHHEAQGDAAGSKLSKRKVNGCVFDISILGDTVQYLILKVVKGCLSDHDFSGIFIFHTVLVVRMDFALWFSV